MPLPSKWLQLYLNCTGPDFAGARMAHGIITALERVIEQLKEAPMKAPYEPHYLFATSGEQIGQWRINTEYTAPEVDYSMFPTRFEVYLRLTDPGFQEGDTVTLKRDRVSGMIQQVKGQLQSAHPRWNGAIRLLQQETQAMTVGNWKTFYQPPPAKG